MTEPKEQPIVGVADRVEIPLTVERSDAPTKVQEPPKAIAPTTTAEENLKTFGQRRINLIWETTQAVVAVSVTVATLGACFFLIAYGGDAGLAASAFLLLSNIFFLVVSTYFQRTNHTRSSKSDEHR